MHEMKSFDMSSFIFTARLSSLIRDSQIRNRAQAAFLFCLTAAFWVCLSGCSAPSTSSERGMTPRQEYEFTGKVVSVDKAERRVTVNHEAIPGFMDAMTMPFALRDSSYFDILQPGDDLRATLVIEQGRSFLDGISVTRETPMTSGASPSPAPDAPREPEIGAAVPSFNLLGEDGKSFSLGDLRNRTVLLTFIYTRCPLPDYCPLMTSNFSEIAKLLSESGVPAKDVQLINISFDPEHDTPPVLREYEARTIEDKASRERIYFATGTPVDIRKIANYFGLLYSRNESGAIDHSLRTALIAPDGKLVKIYRGNQWKAEEVAADIRNVVESSAAMRKEQ